MTNISTERINKLANKTVRMVKDGKDPIFLINFISRNATQNYAIVKNIVTFLELCNQDVLEGGRFHKYVHDIGTLTVIVGYKLDHTVKITDNLRDDIRSIYSMIFRVLNIGSVAYICDITDESKIYSNCNEKSINNNGSESIYFDRSTFDKPTWERICMIVTGGRIEQDPSNINSITINMNKDDHAYVSYDRNNEYYNKCPFDIDAYVDDKDELISKYVIELKYTTDFQNDMCMVASEGITDFVTLVESNERIDFINENQDNICMKIYAECDPKDDKVIEEVIKKYQDIPDVEVTVNHTTVKKGENNNESH